MSRVAGKDPLLAAICHDLRAPIAAVTMGANYVLLEDTRAGNTISGSRGSISGGQTDVTNIGNAYRCESAPTTTSASIP